MNLGYVSHAFAKHPAVSFAGFAALLTIGCFHITWGWAKWLALTPDQTTTTGAERELSKKQGAGIPSMDLHWPSRDCGWLAASE